MTDLQKMKKAINDLRAQLPVTGSTEWDADKQQEVDTHKGWVIVKVSDQGFSIPAVVTSTSSGKWSKTPEQKAQYLKLSEGQLKACVDRARLLAKNPEFVPMASIDDGTKTFLAQALAGAATGGVNEPFMNEMAIQLQIVGGLTKNQIAKVIADRPALEAKAQDLKEGQELDEFKKRVKHREETYDDQMAKVERDLAEIFGEIDQSRENLGLNKPAWMKGDRRGDR